MSIAILYTNPDFRASAMAVDGTTFGIIYPHAQRGSGGDAYMLELRGVPTEDPAQAGHADLHVGPRRDLPARHHDRHDRRRAEDVRGLDANVPRASGGDSVAGDDGAHSHAEAYLAGHGQHLGRGDRDERATRPPSASPGPATRSRKRAAAPRRAHARVGARFGAPGRRSIRRCDRSACPSPPHATRLTPCVPAPTASGVRD